MEFKLLGPVEARSERGIVAMGGPLHRAVLAALLLQPNRPVSIEQLVVAAWGENFPERARTLVQNRVSDLRQAFRRAQVTDELIIRMGSGYLIQVEAGQIDTEQFTRRVAGVGRLVESGDAEGAVEELAGALALWRGVPLDGLTTSYFRAEAKRLEEQRLQAWEQRIRLEISLGRHADLLGELIGLVESHPFHESFHALLMLVLYRAGRHADALEAYKEARDTFVDQLGLEPGRQLRDLHDAVLRTDDGVVRAVAEELGCSPASVIGVGVQPATASPQLEVRPTVPRTLPADDAAFAGRTEQLAELDGVLAASSDRVPASVLICLITGVAGVGKSALAVHWAHQIADRFPDGQLYVNLRPRSGSPTTATEALVALFGALGIRPELPARVEDLAALYRSCVAGRRFLVLLDNASSADQVRHLLPGGPECVVVVTSRKRLTTLVAREGAHNMVLDVVQPEEAHSLLARILGEDRVQAEQAATHELVRVCGCLPFALRNVAAQLANRPHRRIAEQVTRLVDGGNGSRLSALSIDEDTGRSVFDESYVAMPADAQKLLVLLGLAPNSVFTAAGAAALAQVDVPEAEQLLDRLAAEYLVNEREAGRFHVHDLVRWYAQERAVRDAVSERQ
jgi:DNA-binding SARP family transcriptional activator